MVNSIKNKAEDECISGSNTCKNKDCMRCRNRDARILKYELAANHMQNARTGFCSGVIDMGRILPLVRKINGGYSLTSAHLMAVTPNTSDHLTKKV